MSGPCTMTCAPTNGRTVIGISHNAISYPKSKQTLDLHGQTENGTAQFSGSKTCGTNTSCCSDKGVVLCEEERGGGRDILDGKGPQRRPQKPLDRRLEEGAKAVGGGYCRLQMPLRLALGVRGTVAGHRLGALPAGGGGGGGAHECTCTAMCTRRAGCSRPGPKNTG